MKLATASTLFTVQIAATGLLLADPSPELLRQAVRHTSRASEALHVGNLNRAREGYLEAVRLVSMFPDAHVGLGHVAMREGHFEAALFAFEQARFGYTQLGRALLELRVERYTQARQRLAEMESALAQLSSRIDAADSPSAGKGSLTLRGDKMRLQQEISRLRGIQRPAVEKANQPPGEIEFFIGNALMRLGRPYEAVDRWRACARATPRFPLVYNNLAVVSFQDGDYRKAWDYLQRAEKLGFPGNPVFREEVRSRLAIGADADPARILASEQGD